MGNFAFHNGNVASDNSHRIDLLERKRTAGTITDDETQELQALEQAEWNPNRDESVLKDFGRRVFQPGDDDPLTAAIRQHRENGSDESVLRNAKPLPFRIYKGSVNG